MDQFSDPSAYERNTAGNEKVKSGVLDGEIPVLRQDEQGEVCEEFNNLMRYRSSLSGRKKNR